MQTSIIAYRISHIAYRISHIAQSLSRKLGDILRKLARRINRQYSRQCTPDSEVHFQHNNHPSIFPNEQTALKAFTDSQSQKIIFHSYWYGKFGRKQAMSVKSLLATQSGYEYEVWLWLDHETISQNGDDNPYISQLKDKVIIREFSPEIVKSVPEFRKVYFLFGGNENLANRSDGFRIWALHEYGGCYFDLDVMFIRSMGNLLMGSEFVYSWERQEFANSAIIFIRKGSFIAEYLVRKVRRKLSAYPWTIFDYDDKNLRFMKLYECSLFDPLWDKVNGMYILEAFGDFMKANSAIIDGRIGRPEEIFPYSYAYHWHNRWKDDVENNSPFEFCERYFDHTLGL